MTASPERTVGPWTLYELLGRGGNAKLWAATRSGTTDRIALKLITRPRSSMSRTSPSCARSALSDSTRPCRAYCP